MNVCVCIIVCFFLVEMAKNVSIGGNPMALFYTVATNAKESDSEAFVFVLVLKHENSFEWVVNKCEEKKMAISHTLQI